MIYNPIIRCYNPSPLRGAGSRSETEGLNILNRIGSKTNFLSKLRTQEIDV